METLILKQQCEICGKEIVLSFLFDGIVMCFECYETNILAEKVLYLHGLLVEAGEVRVN